MNRFLLAAIASSFLLVGCGGDEPADSKEDERSGASFLEREKERARENEANLNQASEDLFGSAPESAPSDGEDEGAR